MSSQRATFRVEKPFPRDSGTNTAVISLAALEALGWSAGSVVEIRGTEKAVTTVASSRSDEMDDRDIRIDVFARENADVSIGDDVDVSLVQTETADSLIVSIPQMAPATEIGQNEIRRRSKGMAVKIDRYVPIRSNRNPKQSIPLLVRRTRPEGVVAISEGTEIRLEDPDEPCS